MRFGQSRRVAFAVWWKQSVEVLQAALEFGLFVLIQRLLLKRVQQRSGGRDKDQYVRSDRHDALAPTTEWGGNSCQDSGGGRKVLPHNRHLLYRTNTGSRTDSADQFLETVRSTDTRRLVFPSPLVRRERLP